MKRIGIVLGLTLRVTVMGNEIIPSNPTAIADVAAGKCREARAMWWGFDPTDATAALQAAIRSGAHKLIVENPGVPWVVNKLQLVSDQEIVFEPGVVIQAKRGAFHGTGDCLFTATLQTNVTLSGSGATLRMWKCDYDDKAQYTHAEWRHVLSFKSCAGVRVTGLTLADSGGDGIYLGVSRKGIPCSDIVIRDVVCTNNYRQGISVISARNLLIENCTLADTWGTAPEAGIDFEPNMESEELVNCVLLNCISLNNRGDVFTFYLRPLHKISRPISIRIENCRASGCRRSAAFVTGNDSEDAAIRGTIEFSNCTFTGSRQAGITIGDKPASGVAVRFQNCTISNAATNDPTQVPVQFSSSANAAEDLGAIQFDNCTIRDPLGRRPPLAYHDMSGGIGLRDINGTIRLQQSNETAQVYHLTPALLAEWLPPSSFKPIPRFVTQGVHYESALPQAKPGTNSICRAQQRGPSEWLVWTEPGQALAFTVLIHQVGKVTPKPSPVHIIAPSGKVTELPNTQEGAGVTAYEFQPTEAGAHRIQCEPRGGTAIVNSAGQRICLYAPHAVLHLLGTTGVYFFFVPAGTQEFAVKISGDNPGERIRFTLRDPSGKIVAEEDNIFQARQFVARPRNPGQDEIWSMRFDKPTTGVLEDFYVQLQGIPPVLAHSMETLLKPAR